MPEKADIAIIIVQKGFGNYRDLALWTKQNVYIFADEHNNKYTYFGAICALYELHFGLSKEEAKRLAILLSKLGFWYGVSYDENNPGYYTKCYFRV